MSTQAQYNTIAPSGSDYHWRVTAAVTPVLIMSSSQDERAYGSIFNHANGTLFISFGGNNVSPTGSFDVKITSGTLFPLPKPTWQGQVWGVWDAAGGYAMVLQLGDSR